MPSHGTPSDHLDVYDSDEEDELEAAFNTSEWIARGRKFPTNPPPELEIFCKRRSLIPTDFQRKTIPAKSLPVEDFLSETLPGISHDFIHISAKSCFKGDLPNQDLRVISDFDIPSPSFIQSARVLFDQAILDGAQSLEHPCYTASRLPMWIVSWWEEISKVVEKQESWRKALKWLDGHLDKLADDSALKPRFQKARLVLLRLRWDEETRISGAPSRATTSDLAPLLSTSCMTGGLMDMMLNYLSDRVEEDNVLDSFVVIESTRFQMYIEKATTAKDFQEDDHIDPVLLRLESHIKNACANDAVLLFPVHDKANSHWTAFAVDFNDCSISNGDSLSNLSLGPPADFLRKLKWWLGHRFQNLGKFRFLEGGLKHGMQKDTTECGLVTVNTVAHEVFYDPLWSPMLKEAYRMGWFLDLSASHMSEVDSNPKSQFEPYSRPRRTFSLATMLNPDASDPALAPSFGDVAVFGDEQIQSEFEFQAPVAQPVAPSSPVVIDKLPMRMDVDFTPPVQLDRGILSLSIPLRDLYKSEREEPAGFRSKKRSMEEAEIEEQSQRRSDTTIQPMKKPRTEGKSRSAVYERRQQAKFRSGQLNDPVRLAAFTERIQKLDKNSVVLSPMRIRHIRCGKSLSTGAPFKTSNYEKHLQICKGPPKASKLNSAGVAKTLDQFFGASSAPQSSAASAGGKAVPCVGLRAAVHSEVARLLERTAMLGGGGVSLTVVSNQLYNKPFRRLKQNRKHLVRLAQRDTWLWRNEHELGAVFSTSCAKNVTSGSTCFQCLALKRKKKFKNAAGLPVPDDAKRKFVPRVFRQEKLMALFSRYTGLKGLFEELENNHDSPVLRYVSHILEKKQQNSTESLFLGLIEGMAQKKKRADESKGNQNFKHAPAVKEFAHIVAMHSPAAYKFLEELLPLPKTRTLQIDRAKEPRLPLTISDRTFSRLEEQIKLLSYTGPIALACDDTKLLPALRPYYDKETDAFYVVGNAGEPFRLLDPEAFEAAIHEAGLKKATKLRLWTAQIPIPKVPPIIVAALAISDDMNAESLFPYLWTIITGCIEKGIRISTYAADGSTVERSVQRLLEQKASRRVDIVIDHPDKTSPQITIPLRFYGSQPIANIQDAFHFSKTCRNNVFSSARLLTLPNGVVTFADIVEIALSPDSPFFKRDVFDPDKQDDDASTRFHSASVLDWIVQHKAELEALLVFLFVCGEMVDAYQNRKITLSKRLRMLLRGHFFFELWEKFLKKAGYSKAKHYVSYQFADIKNTLVFGFVQAVLIYRDYGGSSDTPIPLLPWLICTEVLEHVFGISRTLIKDFTALDFVYMIPKLGLKLRQAIFSDKVSDGKQRASGYDFRYMDTRHINLVALATYPTNEELEDIFKSAYADAEALFALLGVSPAHLNSSPSYLPPIDSWHKPTETTSSADQDSEVGSEDETDWSDIESESDDEEDIPEEEKSRRREARLIERVASRWQEAIDDTEESADRYGVEKRRTELTCGLIALSIEQQMAIQDLPELTDDDLLEAAADDNAQIASTLANSLPAPNDTMNTASIHPVQTAAVVDTDFVDIHRLVQLRKEHQTEQAATGIRTARERQEPSSVAKRRFELLKEMNEILKDSEQRGVGTGLERSVRWTQAFKGAKGGNAGNAAAVARATATKALKLRGKFLESLKLPEFIQTGRVSDLSPLHAAGRSSSIENENSGAAWGFIVHEEKLKLGRVLAVNSKSGGKHGRHGYIEKASNLAAVSYMSLQVYDHFYASQFRERPEGQMMHMKRYAHITPSLFLCTLLEAPSLGNNTGPQLSSRDYAVFTDLRRDEKAIVGAMKTLDSRKKKSALLDALDKEEDE
ncbi:Methionine--tRNA ligase, mitochondrial [Marasmius crinis-equi]|uniref:Methionine--tRNA ligase, mitochondrial n=1 Tax=Marasmius crinis-equi TaxID=585013 RepID=A0ABR3FB07_9AGAR